MLTRFTLLMLLACMLSPTSGLMAGENEATVLFHIECPPDVWLDCDDEIWDLSAYGWAYVYGYGSPVPASDPVVSYHLNSCGTGYITRTWTAYDYQNNPYSCTQHIYVGPDGGFNESNIHWPPDYMTDDCNAHLNPDDLPAPYDYPTHDDVDCSMIMIGYDDLVFNFGGGCKKILRTWSLLDWCSYNPNYPNSGGRWDHTQILKIKPSGGITLNCPDDILASAGADCSGTYVSIPVVTGSGACGSNVTVTNNSPYANSGGANASGYYPFGTTYVTFTVDDACGNWGSCQMKVVVKDMKKPTPICYNGLTANLMMNLDGYYMDLDAEWFNKGSFDNCTPDHLLRYRIEPSRFTCDDLGRQEVKVYVKDLDGNEQYCRTYVIIQDNMGMCPPIDTTSFTLSGSLQNIQGIAMPGIDLELMEDISMVNETSSDQTGFFTFNHVMNGMNYMVVPQGNDAYTLGLSTFDLLKLAKHIYGIKLFETNGELLAADADQDGEVNVQDLLTLRMLLLNYTDNLPNNKAWRFIPTHILENNDDVLTMNVEEYWRMEDLQEDVTDIDFTVIKIGDINGSVQNFGAASERSQKNEISLNVNKKENVLEFSSTRSLDVAGLQLELNLGEMEFERIQRGVLNVSSSDIRIKESSILISHISLGSNSLVESGDVLFSIVLSKSRSIQNLDVIPDYLKPELYSVGEVVYTVKLDSKEEIVKLEEISELSIFPNPSQNHNDIQIISNNHTIEQIQLLNSRGNIHLMEDQIGLNEYIISIGDFSPGLYFVHVKMADGQIKLEKLVIE